MEVLSLVSNDDAKFYRQQVAGLRNRGHTIDTLAVPGRRVENGADMERRSVSTYAKYYFHAACAKFDEYDIVHANYGLTAPPAVVPPTRPVVLSLWGSDLLGEYGWVSRFCSRFADAVVVMSEDMADRVDEECHVIPHGVDFDRFRPLPQADARAELGWDQDAHQVLFPYAPSREIKNFPRAKRVVDRIRAELDDPVELQTMSGVAHDHVPWYMNAADALLLTSKREGSPNTVKEALACNLPVIATDVGDVADQVTGVAHSTVASDDEALANALRETLRAGERSDGRESIRHLRLATQLDRLEAVYRSVARREAIPA